MKSRKTISVDTLVETANGYLAGKYGDQEFRKGVMAMTESVLHDSGRYRGFRYLTRKELPAGTKPGINTGPDGEVVPFEDRFTDTDYTRVSYYA